MKEALVSKGPLVQIVDSPVPEPNDDQVLIKVVVSGSNPKDWKLPEMQNLTANAGDDIAGIVEKVGANVYEFKPGDRVAAFHEVKTEGGSYAEYGIAWQHTTFHIPKQTSFEEAAAIPLAAMTAVVGLYQHLALPQPWSLPLPETPTRETPLVIYGASSSVGFYALQLALRSNIHPIICVAGRASEYVRGFIDKSKGDTVIDYREGPEVVVDSIKKALEGKPAIGHVFDAFSEGNSAAVIGQVFEQAGDGKTAKFTFTSWGNKPEIPQWVQQNMVFVGSVHMAPQAKDLAYVYFRYIARGLQEGWFRAQRTEVVPGGLNGIQKALENLKNGNASALKYVFRI
ncbi:hypothetical protein JX266_013241 [Neoarthrinium moseri]|nr:hypothetical protein JX266_013241 [Neoarthrinium moseri]